MTQVIIGLDTSRSMQSRFSANATRVAVVKELAASVIKTACGEDPDGVDTFLFGEKLTKLGAITEAQIETQLAKLTAEEYGTCTGAYLREAFKLAKPMVERGERVVVFVFTDGDATDRELVKSEIRAMAKWQVDHGYGRNCSVEIVYVGNDALPFLKELDDDLNAAIDMVDTQSIEAASAMDVEALFNNAFND